MYNVGDRINHKIFGWGTVIESSSVDLPASNESTNYITVEFDTVTSVASDEWKPEGHSEKVREFTAASIRPYLI